MSLYPFFTFHVFEGAIYANEDVYTSRRRSSLFLVPPTTPMAAVSRSIAATMMIMVAGVMSASLIAREGRWLSWPVFHERVVDGLIGPLHTHHPDANRQHQQADDLHRTHSVRQRSWRSYKQERDCFVHFLRLLALCWPSAQVHETITFLLVT